MEENINEQVSITEIKPEVAIAGKYITCLLEDACKKGDVFFLSDTDKGISLMDGSKSIGTLAAPDSSIRPDCLTAAEVGAGLTDGRIAGIYARVCAIHSPLALAQLYPVPAHGSTKNTVYTYSLSGGMVTAPGKKDAIARLAADTSGVESCSIHAVTTSNSIQVYDSVGSIVGSIVGIGNSDESAKYLNKALNSGNPVSGKLHLSPDGKALIVTLSPDVDMALIEKTMDEVAAAGIEQYDELKRKSEVMCSAGISDEIIMKVFQSYHCFDDEMTALIPHPEYPYVDDPGANTLKRAIAYHLHGKHIRLVGDKGCGKNTLIETVCWLMHQPIFRLSGSSDLDKTDILGSRTIQNGSMGYELTTFLRVLEAGGDVDLDEINTIKPDIAILIHSLTDQTRAINVPGYGDVRMADSATFWATMNEDYVGTTDMNDATIDRFVTLRLRSADDITEMLQRRVPSATQKQLTTCQRIHADLLASVRSGLLNPNCISIRGYIDALECASLLPIAECLKDTIASKPQDADERQAILTIIENHLGH